MKVSISDELDEGARTDLHVRLIKRNGETRIDPGSVLDWQTFAGVAPLIVSPTASASARRRIAGDIQGARASHIALSPQLLRIANTPSMGKALVQP